MNLYQLADQLSVTPKTLKSWLKKHGFGRGKSISPKAEQKAREHFKPADGPMAQAIQSERAGLGQVKRHEDQLNAGLTIRVRELPQRKWERVDREGPSVDELTPTAQKDFFRSLRDSRAESRAVEQPEKHKPETPIAQPNVITPPQKTIQDYDLSMEEALLVHDHKQVRAQLTPQNKLSRTQRRALAHRQKAGESHKERNPDDGNRAEQDVTTTDEDRFVDAYYKRAYDDLLRDYHALKARVKQLDLRNKSLNEDLSTMSLRLGAPSKVARDHDEDTMNPDGTHPVLIWDELHDYGLDAQGAIQVFIELLRHPSKGPDLIYSLQTDPERPLLKGFSLCCMNPVCVSVAKPKASLGLVSASGHLCTVCQGQASRRWYQRLLLSARKRSLSKVVLVGGGDEDHMGIKQFSREYPGIRWTFVQGSQRVDQTRANNKVSESAVVILWSGLHLPHSLSHVFKQAAQKHTKPCFAIEPGKRSVSSICQGILRSWGEEF